MREYKRRMSPFYSRLPRRYAPRNDRGTEKAINNVIANDRRECGNLNSQLETNILLTLAARTYTLNAVRYTLVCSYFR